MCAFLGPQGSHSKTGMPFLSYPFLLSLSLSHQLLLLLLLLLVQSLSPPPGTGIGGGGSRGTLQREGRCLEGGSA